MTAIEILKKNREEKIPTEDMIVIWIVVGSAILLIGGIKLFVLWLTPGVPPPGPFG